MWESLSQCVWEISGTASQRALCVKYWNVLGTCQEIGSRTLRQDQCSHTLPKIALWITGDLQSYHLPHFRTNSFLKMDYWLRVQAGFSGNIFHLRFESSHVPLKSLAAGKREKSCGETTQVPAQEKPFVSSSSSPEWEMRWVLPQRRGQ